MKSTQDRENLNSKITQKYEINSVHITGSGGKLWLEVRILPEASIKAVKVNKKYIQWCCLTADNDSVNAHNAC